MRAFYKLLFSFSFFKKVKTLMLGEIEDRGERATEDEMVGWHHRLNRHEFEQALGDGEGQGSLVCCSPWGSQRVGYK